MVSVFCLDLWDLVGERIIKIQNSLYSSIKRHSANIFFILRFHFLFVKGILSELQCQHLSKARFISIPHCSFCSYQAKNLD